MRNRILYLYGPHDFNESYKFHLNAIMSKAGLSFGDCFMLNLHKEVKDGYKTVKQGNRIKYKHNREQTQVVREKINAYINRIKPNWIVCTDPSALYVFSGGNDSVAQCRGSVYIYAGIGVMVVDYIERIRDTHHGKWVAINDWQKCSRFIRGTPKPEPKFIYRVCRTRADLLEFESFMLRSSFVTCDSETIDNWISCIGYSGLSGGVLQQWIVPFFNPLKPGGCHWASAVDEEFAWTVVRRVHGSEGIKILQNGHYDAGYFIKWRIPLENYFVDTMHMWHCIYAELPKRIDFISSIVVDHYQFWKEEAKGEDKDENETLKQTSEDKLERFWRYCALDCYYTTLSANFLVRVVLNLDWVRDNYHMQFSLQVGPALAMECRGIRVDFNQLQRLRAKWESKRDASLAKVRVMVDQEDFNPRSSDQVGQLFYKVLGAKEVKVGGKTGAADEDTLKMLAEQHVIYDIFAQAILDYREAATEISKYLYFLIRGKRFHCSMHAAGAWTSRFSSGSFMWEGTNGQNLPEDIRSFLVADPGYVFFDIDASQSDARYIAYESEDPTMIKLMQSSLDTHCFHAAHFFKEKYEDILAKVKAKVHKYAHTVTGIRALTKRIVHGTNFRMTGRTLYVRMGGRAAVIAAAEAIGIYGAAKKTYKELVAVCDLFIEAYHQLYPRLRPWYSERNAECARDHRLTTSFGWTRQFFGSSDDPRIQREIAAFYGQGNTGGNLNRAMFAIYYGYKGKCLETEGVRLLLQVHDSLFGEVKETDVSLLKEICELMELPVTIHGRECVVPAECAVGFRWNKDCLVKLKREEWSDVTAIRRAFIAANGAEREHLAAEYGVN